jgi:hypothetical protein
VVALFWRGIIKTLDYTKLFACVAGVYVAFNVVPTAPLFDRLTTGWKDSTLKSHADLINVVQLVQPEWHLEEHIISVRAAALGVTVFAAIAGSGLGDSSLEEVPPDSGVAVITRGRRCG